MNIDTTLQASSFVVTREVGGELMLMDLESGTYFGLDPIGGRVWQAIEDGTSLAELCDELAGDYAVTREQLEKDVVALAQDLLEKNLVSEA